MFTGIIEELGRIGSVQPSADGAVIGISSRMTSGQLRDGDSIAVNGVCLTVTSRAGEEFHCDLSAETLRRSSLGRLTRGRGVNLERPLPVGGRLGGHFVLGHVDGVGRLLRSEPSGDGCVLTFQYPRELERYLVHKGSVAVDGISLTVADLEGDRFSVAVIPHTLAVTNLKELSPGDEVNLEADILGKYFERFFQLGIRDRQPSKLTAEYLEEQGY